MKSHEQATINTLHDSTHRDHPATSESAAMEFSELVAEIQRDAKTNPAEYLEHMIVPEGGE